MSTWLEFKTLVKEFLPVDAIRHNVGVVTSGTSYLDNLIRQGVIDLQHYIDLYRLGHESTYQVDDLGEEGEASIGSLPCEAILREAYYVKTGEPCIRQPLDQYDYSNRYDLICGNLRVMGCQYAIAVDPQARSFYVFPKVVDGRHVTLVWDGKKLEFEDTDQVPFDEAMAMAVAEFASAYIERKVNKDLAMFESHLRSYNQKRSQLYTASRERKRFSGTAKSEQAAGVCVSCEADDSTIEFVAFGDSGESPLDNTEAVAALAKMLEPDFIIHLGDTNYPAGSSTTIEDHFRKFYASWIEAEDFYLAFGEVDDANASSAALLNLLSYLKDLNSGKRYYNFVRGEAEFFVIHSQDETDGITSSSVQGQWLQAKLAASAAVWKIVCVHKAPYSSETTVTPGVTDLRWPFKTWGADLVLSAHGHNYERILVDDFPYLVIGTGGVTKKDFGTVTTGSQFRYNSKYGAVRVSVNATRLQIVFYNTNGDPVDTLTLRA